MAELNAWARRVAESTGKKVPLFDPRSGGTNARLLLLLQDPSEVAQHGSGFISRDNNDPTANNTAALMDQVGLDYGQVVAWNVVPWWVKDPALAVDDKLRTLTAEAKLAAPYVGELLVMLESVVRVVLIGKEALKAWDRTAQSARIRALEVHRCPHTSPLAYNQPANREQTRETFARAKAILRS